jgi:hypothetical protein
MLDKTANINTTVQQVTPLAELLRRARIAAEMIESWSCDLDAVLASIRFEHAVPDEVGSDAADLQAFLETMNAEIQSVVYELDAAIHDAQADESNTKVAA